MVPRLVGLIFLVGSLGACAFGIGAQDTQEPELTRFSEMVGVAADAPTVSLAATPSATDDLTVAGANLLDAIFAPSAATGQDDTRHQFGAPVPYGQIATVCDAPRRPGTQLAKIGGFTIYDSAPGATAMRPHYVTGFDDGCARQFSAALVMTGDVGTHEVVRYMAANKADYNQTDSAYEAIKASFCRVRHGKPCGRRLEALGRQTAFITAYDRFGSGATWVEILLHDGAVKAIDFKSR